MTIGYASLLFFDAACLVAAAGSPRGGSGFLLTAASRGFFQSAASASVLLEAERNVTVKLGLSAWDRYQQVIIPGLSIVLPAPTAEEERRFHGMVTQKDEHVIAAAIQSGAAYLLTMDRPFIASVNRAGIPIWALTPAEFIKTVLPGHEDYHLIRE